MNYDEWNDLLADHFFNADVAGQRIRLNVTRKLLDDLGSPHGASADDFVRAVTSRDVYGGDDNICTRAAVALRQWQQRKEYVSPQRNPGYFGYLCFMVLAVGEGEFSEHAYYPRLRHLLGETPQPGGFPQFDKTIRLWADLQTWLSGELRGRRGFFIFARRGQHPYVSLPRAQVLLSDLERQRIHGLFGISGIDPEQRITRADLANRLRAYGATLLSQGTLKLLAVDSEFREYLLDDVEYELESYDPSEDAPPEDGIEADSPVGRSPKAPSTYRSTIALGINLKLDGPRVTCRFRFKLNQPIPEDTTEQGFSFVGVISRTPELYACGGRFPGWSSCLETTAGEPVDAAAFDWLTPFELKGVELPELVLRYPASPVRCFVSGFTSGLPGYIEAPYLPYGVTCLIAISPPSHTLFETWAHAVREAMSNPQAIQQLVTRTGFPHHWSLYELHTPVDNHAIYECFPGPKEPKSCRILLRGGIPVPGKPNSYFRFGPPLIIFSGYAAECELAVNGHPLESLGNREYALPQPALSCIGDLLVVASSKEDVLASRRLRFQDSNRGSQREGTILARFWRDGRLITDDTNEYFAGCLVVRPNPRPVSPPAMSVLTNSPAPRTRATPPVKLVVPINNHEVSPSDLALAAFQRTLEHGSESWKDQGGNTFAIVRKRRLLIPVDVKAPAQLAFTMSVVAQRGFRIVGAK